MSEPWSSASLALVRVGRPTAEDLEAHGAWIAAALDECPDLPPLGVVVDVGRLALGARWDGAPPPPELDRRLRAALRAYEDHLLARVAADPRLEAIQEAATRLPPALWPQAVGVLVAQLVHRLGFSGGMAVAPAAIRRVCRRPLEGILEEARRALADASTLDGISRGYEALAGSARSARALLADSDVFLIEHLASLKGLSERVSVAQVLDVAEELERALPARIKRASPRVAHVASRVQAASAYPAGGFSALAHAGSFESLVSSELAFLEESGELDLFDVRYAEGELLYYARDQGLHLRRRRTIAVVLEASLARVRFKDPGARWQRPILALGLAFAVMSRLRRWLGDEDLTFRWSVVGGGAGPLAPELALCRVLLRAWIDRGLAQVDEVPSLEEARVRLERDALEGRADGLLITADSGPAGPPGEGARWVTLSVGQPRPALFGLDPTGAAGLTEPEAWSEVAIEVLRALS